jgi:hypothetical protein
MEFKHEVYGSYCAMDELTINGIQGDPDDFGTQRDASPETAEEYGCGDMTFFPKESTVQVLEKYNISECEYQQIASILADKLSFGRCGMCI